MQSYVKTGVTQQASNGGEVKAAGNQWRPNTDGTRGMVGCGVAWQLSARDQVHLDSLAEQCGVYAELLGTKVFTSLLPPGRFALAGCFVSAVLPERLSGLWRTADVSGFSR